jgi:hypothetical protein
VGLSGGHTRMEFGRFIDSGFRAVWL